MRTNDLYIHRCRSIDIDAAQAQACACLAEARLSAWNQEQCSALVIQESLRLQDLLTTVAGTVAAERFDVAG